MRCNELRRDALAGLRLKAMREERGWTRPELRLEMARAGVPSPRIPSVKTIYNVEELGQVPRNVGTKFAFATVYGVAVTHIWETRTRATALAA